MRGGRLLLLDFALLPNLPIQWWPSAASPGPVNQAPFQVLFWFLTRLGPVAGPLLIFGVFFIMGIGAHRAVAKIIAPDRAAAAYFAGTLYAINPFTYGRLMAGHLLLLIAYAAAPFLVVAAVDFVRSPGARTAARLAALITLIAWSSVHYLGFLPLLLVALLVFRRETWHREIARWGLLVVGAVLVANAWWIAGLFEIKPGELVGPKDVVSYATRPLDSYASAGNTAALYGFWRHEFRDAKDGVRAWWLLFLPVAGLAMYGFARCVKDPKLRPLALALIVVVPLAILVAAGPSFPPTRGVFRWLFVHVPGFRIYREPQKWVALLPLAYSLLGAAGLDRLMIPSRSASAAERRVVAVAALVAVLVPLGYAWTLVWNWDRLRPVHFPRDWVAAERIMSNSGGGAMLFLPWHLYMQMTFTGYKVVNPAPSYFSVPVVSGDNVELPGIYTQSQNSLSHQVEAVLFRPRQRAGLPQLLSDHCIRWVALAKETDFRNYGWIRSLGLERVYEGPRLTLWRANIPLSC
jgi:hypothetical protein